MPGHRLSDIGHRVQTTVEGAGFSVVRDFAGPRHRPRHARAALDPELRRAGARTAPAAGHGLRDRADGDGGRPEVRVLDDEWTAVTADGSLAAHFEHTILITEHGPEVLTRIEGSH